MNKAKKVCPKLRKRVVLGGYGTQMGIQENLQETA